MSALTTLFEEKFRIEEKILDCKAKYAMELRTLETERDEIAASINLEEENLLEQFNHQLKQPNPQVVRELPSFIRVA